VATAPPRPDAALLERLRARDRTAWDEIYRLYEGRLYAFAYRLTGNPHDAADLVQETFLRALPRLDQLPPERADIAAYLFATEKNLFLKSVERTRRQQPVEEVPEPDEPAAIEDDPQRSALLRRQQEEVRIANGKLAPRQRMVLALRELEDKSYAEIGVLVGLNENAVAQLISRARQSLREELRLVQVERSKLPPECREFLPLLSAHLDGQLKGAKLERTLAHLEGCEACQAALADMREASRRYRAVVPPIIGVAALKDQIGDALGATGYWQQPVRSGLGLRAAMHGRTLVAAAVVGLVALGGLGGGIAIVLSGSTGGDTPGSTVAAATATAPAAVAAATSPSEAVKEIVAPAAGTDVSSSEQPGKTTAVEAVEGTAPATTANESQTEAATQTDAETQAPTETATETTATRAESTGEDPPDPEPVRLAAPAILSGPNDPTRSRRAAFRFSATGATSYRCSLDGGAFAACSASRVYSGLTPGRHRFSVRGVRGGAQGPASSFAWTITEPALPPPPATTAPPTSPPTTTEPPADRTPPSATITSGPPTSTTETGATFSFTAGEPASFTCGLDGSGFSPCSSPKGYQGLATGQHTFTVRATDAAGNTGAPASYSWTITPPALPDLVVSNLTASSATITNAGSAPAGPFVLTVSVPGGTFTIPGLAPGASATRTWSTCIPPGNITATADSGGQVVESSEGNNSRSTSGAC
jgi:RNA polymerase sigma factor (sigma-70 family)